MQTHDTALAHGAAYAVTATRPLTRPLEFGRLTAGQVYSLPPCETCDGSVNGGAVVYSFPVHNIDGRARIWHADCAGQRRLLRALRNRVAARHGAG